MVRFPAYLAATWRSATPKREMIALLGELGQQERKDYFREYRLAPGVCADFA